MSIELDTTAIDGIIALLRSSVERRRARAATAVSKVGDRARCDRHQHVQLI
jgi:hypothetical protein